MIIIASNPFVLAYVEADFLGKLIFLGLFALSFLCWSILLYKLWIRYQIQKIIPSFEKLFHEQKKTPLNLSFDQIENSKDHPFNSLYKEVNEKTREILNKNQFFKNESEGVHLSKTDMDLIESSLYYVINEQSSRFEKNLYVLSMITSLAPFLGLLGTVWDILITFSGLTTHSMTNINTTVLSGLSMALTTTVIGLIVAIPALIGYNTLKNSSKNLAKKMEEFSKNLLHTIEIQYRKVDL